MEFNEKLQHLRRQRNLTQQELSELLYVSRTAVSKWESGKGYPSIDSLKALSRIFALSVDDLLSSREILAIAEADKRLDKAHWQSILYGLLDLLSLAFIFLPLFAQQKEDGVLTTSLLALRQTKSLHFIIYSSFLGFLCLFGLAEISLQNSQNPHWQKFYPILSIATTLVATLLFILSQQPYPAFLMLWILLVKGFVHLKRS